MGVSPMYFVRFLWAKGLEAHGQDARATCFNRVSRLGKGTVMDKKTFLPGDKVEGFFNPGSIVLVTTVDSAGKADVCTVGAWSIVNGAPLMYGIAMCARRAGEQFWKRYTTTCIEQTGQFVINIPHAGLAEAWAVCGSVSLTRRPEADKFALAGLTPTPAAKVAAPLIAECPVNIECRVHSKLTLPTHDWIVGEPLAFHVAADLVAGKARMRWTPAATLE